MVADLGLIPTADLYTMLQNNMRVIKNFVDMLIGDAPYPDPRIVADMVIELGADRFLEHLKDQKDEFLKNLDLLELVAQITIENNQIYKELVGRV